MIQPTTIPAWAARLTDSALAKEISNTERMLQAIAREIRRRARPANDPLLSEMEEHYRILLEAHEMRRIP